MKPELTSVPFSYIIFDEGLYPRVEGHDPIVVQTYARDMEQIEAAGKFISINAENVLLDGRHRMLAYKKRADGETDFTVQAYKYDVTSPLESFRLACGLQDRGKSLSNDDRVTDAKKLYSLGDHSQKGIAEILGVSQATISGWLSRTIKDERERKKNVAQELWLACHTQQEIADRIEAPQRTVADWINSFSELSVTDISLFSRDFTPPIYNVWRRTKKTSGPDHFGNSEPRWLENLVYLYTEPGSIVVDPFAGSGSTIDVCKKRKRRYFVSDRKPIVEREHEIRRHDLTDGLPKVPRWKDVKLVYLDPPYWKQAEGQYSDDPTDLANMSLAEFHELLAEIINGFAKKVSDAHITLIIQPTQWRAPDRQFTDHVAEMIRRVRLPIKMRFSAPYESEQYTAQMVDWAKRNKECLVLTREILIWKV